MSDQAPSPAEEKPAYPPPVITTREVGDLTCETRHNADGSRWLFVRHGARHMATVRVRPGERAIIADGVSGYMDVEDTERRIEALQLAVEQAAKWEGEKK